MTTRTHSLQSFSTHLTMHALVARHEQRHALNEVGQLILAEARSAMGTYRYGWPPLQPSTVARKRNGDTPLVETGEMRRDYGVNLVDDTTVEVGSNNPKAIWHELGTGHVPPRPVLQPAAQAVEPRASQIIGDRCLRGLFLR